MFSRKTFRRQSTGNIGRSHQFLRLNDETVTITEQDLGREEIIAAAVSVAMLGTDPAVAHEHAGTTSLVTHLVWTTSTATEPEAKKETDAERENQRAELVSAQLTISDAITILLMPLSNDQEARETVYQIVRSALPSIAPPAFMINNLQKLLRSDVVQSSVQQIADYASNVSFSANEVLIFARLITHMIVTQYLTHIPDIPVATRELAVTIGSISSGFEALTNETRSVSENFYLWDTLRSYLERTVGSTTVKEKVEEFVKSFDVGGIRGMRDEELTNFQNSVGELLMNRHKHHRDKRK